MYSRVRDIFLEQPKGTRARRVIFGALAALLLLLDVFSWYASWTDPSALAVEPLIAGCLALALTGWLPATGGTLYALVTGIVLLAPGDSGITFPLVGIFAVVAEWISRKWYLQAVLALALVQVPQFLTSTNWQADAMGLLLGLAVAVPIGLGVQWSEERAGALRQEVKVSQVAAESAAALVRRDLNLALHDTVAQDLVRIIVSGQSAARRTTDPQTAEEVQELSELARDAMRHVRALMGDVGVGHTDPVQPLGDVLATCQAMLAGRAITLDADLPEDIDAVCSLRQRSVLGLVLREGTTNILKYARVGTTAHLSVEVLEDGTAAVTMANLIDPAADDTRGALSGGYGLDSLTERAAREGGSLHFGSNGGTWLLSVTVPRIPVPEDGRWPLPASPAPAGSPASSDGTGSIGDTASAAAADNSADAGADTGGGQVAGGIGSEATAGEVAPPSPGGVPIDEGDTGPSGTPGTASPAETGRARPPLDTSTPPGGTPPGPPSGATSPHLPAPPRPTDP